MLQGLNQRQVDAVTLDAAPLCVLAGAGSGKTRVLTRRIAWRIAQGTADPSRVMAVTFTRKAAGELRERLGQLGIRDRVAAGTFHGMALAQLRSRWADLDRPRPALVERKAGLLSRLAPARVRNQVSLADLAGEIEWAKARMIPPERYDDAARRAGRKPPFGQMAEVYLRYEEEKRRRGMVDFDDLLWGCIEAMQEDPSFAAAQRWRFRHFFVDEYQDINPVQAWLLGLWLGDSLDLCVVGDPDQAIYSWNGADPSQILEFPRRHPSAEVVRLDDNYRSSPQVLAVANAVLAQGASRAGSGLRPNRADGPVPTVVCYDNDTEEATGIARGLRRIRCANRPWSDMAVLARTNAQLVLLEEALRARGIPYRVSGGGAFLEQAVVRTALVGMSRVAGGFPAAVADLRERPAGAGGPDGEEERRLLDQLVRLSDEYRSVDSEPSVEGFGDWLATSVRTEATGDDGDVVELTTFHRSKGLEWSVVHLVGLERGLVPIGHACTPSEEAEERRLLYVAMTRARAELHCSWAERRTFGSRAHSRRPSPYLDAVAAACRALAEGRRTTDIIQLATARSKLAKSQAGPRTVRPAEALATTADPELLAALREWRSTAARASGVPAYVICHDMTLASVAARKPATHEELLALPGIGQVKAARYGDILLDLVSDRTG